jgi:acyl carrier protein
VAATTTPPEDAPHDATEGALLAIWAQLLQVERVGRTDEFFALGGHSLLAIRAIARIKDALGVAVPLKVMFARPTVASLAEHIRGQLG